MKITKILALATLLLTGSVTLGGIGEATLPHPLCTGGEIVEVEDNGIVVKGEGAYPLVKVLVDTSSRTSLKPSAEMQGRYKTDMGINLGLERQRVISGTLIVDGTNGRPLSIKKLLVGKQVVAYYDGNVTRSYPPQARGEAVVLATKPEKVGQYFVVAEAKLSDDRRSAVVTNTAEDLIATIPGKACAGYREIKPGMKLLIWSDLQTLSLPAQTVATKARILE